MATPARIQPPNPTNSIKSAARKLPIKRKSPPQPQSQSQSPAPTPVSIDPTPFPRVPSLDPSIILSNNPTSSAYADFDEDEGDEFDDESQEHDAGFGSNGGGGGEITVSAHGTSAGDHLNPPPFKFHRIWSEPDEIRFLQGLIGCWSQGLVFPRDLNVFYDRFSESMPQPYTRSQLSEKLRRLRRKFRVTSARIARGLDSNRLAPHDRDLLHLCMRLWDPQYASTSPFLAAADASAATAPVPGTAGNKRRRRNPRRPKFEDGAPQPTSSNGLEKENVVAVETAVEERPVPMAIPSIQASIGKDGEVGGYVVAKAVLNVFDGSLEEIRMSLNCSNSSGGSALTRRWQEQRIAELDVFARRLRLMLEQSLGLGSSN